LWPSAADRATFDAIVCGESGANERNTVSQRAAAVAMMMNPTAMPALIHRRADALFAGVPLRSIVFRRVRASSESRWLS
jgi:hypothetical protein